MYLSVVTTLYCSECYIEDFYRRTIESIGRIKCEKYEIIFVDDGSPDNSLGIAQKLGEQDSRVKIVELSKNYGQHKALMAGIEHSRGDYIFTVNIDLDEPIEDLEKLWQKMENNPEVDFIYGIQDRESQPFVKKFMARSFYSLLNFLSHYKVPEDMLILSLMTKRFRESLLKFNEKALFFPAIFPLIGYKQSFIKCKKMHNKNTSYNFSKQIQLLIDALISMESNLFVIIFLGSLALTFLGLLLIILSSIFVSITEFYLILMILIVCCLNLSILGLFGIYLFGLMKQVRNRPSYIVKKTWP